MIRPVSALPLIRATVCSVERALHPVRVFIGGKEVFGVRDIKIGGRPLPPQERLLWCWSPSS